MWSNRKKKKVLFPEEKKKKMLWWSGRLSGNPIPRESRQRYEKETRWRATQCGRRATLQHRAISPDDCIAETGFHRRPRAGRPCFYPWEKFVAGAPVDSVLLLTSLPDRPQSFADQKNGFQHWLTTSYFCSVATKMNNTFSLGLSAATSKIKEGVTVTPLGKSVACISDPCIDVAYNSTLTGCGSSLELLSFDE